MVSPFQPVAYGWGLYGAYAVRSGETIRLGLTWPGDPGAVYLSASAGWNPTTLTRVGSTRETAAHPDYAWVTTEWITITADSPLGWVEEIGLSYLATHDAADIVADEQQVVPIALRFHVIAQAGRVLAWVKVPPPRPGHPVPVIAPVRDEHTLHLDVELEPAGEESAGENAEDTAERLSTALAG